mmetsp:Transcript_109980/g.354707  ORF Transcript_109980/g.354707 Transcript_109980/m.354707 type:complete len:488 (+) Transcript_109980:111-1574(+)|eukprot:CAMPEP_0203856210 /NCGR_PEP_ID=MMETSP0359-20131031/10054_1 /ASSEMBLY_ACC=CAM_ASM_000338 /TAXON_ID=268821 /ORGANISM="Scrippsiella Hangoei, Strain SHTV-5" /LENGTH=487 /DNA_ID=CAMNT_0050772803 /DNA_START=101 /DNA_END=1564 /DNA_ORIENTATION=+
MPQVVLDMLNPGCVGRVLEELRGVLGGVTWRRLGGLLSGGVLCRLLWSQYGILLKRRLPYWSMGWPILGHTPGILSMTIEGWADKFMQGKPPAVLANYLFTNTVIVSYQLYSQHIHSMELDGKLGSEFPPSFSKLLGTSSVLTLPGGKGHQHHKRLRTKLLHSLAPKPCLEVLPEMSIEVRKMLDKLAEDTARNGFASFEASGSHLAAKVSTLQITAGLSKDLQARVEDLVDTVVSGLFSVPVNLGRFSAFGRALAARRELQGIVTQLLKRPILDKRNILADLAKVTEGGEAFTTEEILDTIITLLLAGKLTTSDALPNLFVNLSQQPDWAAKVAQESLEFTSIESDSAALRVVLESLRIVPPVGAYRRVDKEKAIDLGEHGQIPAGCQFAVFLKTELAAMGDGFDPGRWTSDVVKSHGWLAFGGHQPHSCIGRSLALLELQLFARILCREYDFKALDTERIVKASNPINKCYRDGLRVTVTRKARP